MRPEVEPAEVVRPGEPAVVPWLRVPDVVLLPRAPDVGRCRPLVGELPLVPFLRRVAVVVEPLIGLAGLMVFVSSVTVPAVVPAVVLVGGMVGGVPVVVPKVVVPVGVGGVPAVVWACAAAPASSSATRMIDFFIGDCLIV